MNQFFIDVKHIIDKSCKVDLLDIKVEDDAIILLVDRKVDENIFPRTIKENIARRFEATYKEKKEVLVEQLKTPE